MAEINRPEAYSHFKLCRESPEYRMTLMQIDMEAQLEPSLCQDPEPKEVICVEDNQWTNRQWDEVQQLKAMVLHSQKKIDEMRANAKKKSNRYKYK